MIIMIIRIFGDGGGGCAATLYYIPRNWRAGLKAASNKNDTGTSANKTPHTRRLGARGLVVKNIILYKFFYFFFFPLLQINHGYNIIIYNVVHGGEGKEKPGGNDKPCECVIK